MTTTTDRDTAALRLRLAYAAGMIYLRDLHKRLETLAGDPDDVTVARLTAGLPAATSHRDVAGSHKLYPLDIAVLDELVTVADPVARVKHAAVLGEAYADEQEKARVAQNAALVAAHVRYQVPQATCYEAVGMLRRPFRAAVRRRPSVLPDYGSGEACLAAGVEQRDLYVAARSKAETARLVRDAGIRTLIDGVTITNAGLARQLEMTTARIAQIKTEYTAA